MKKFDRLPVENRKAEICIAATELFLEKGFRATTMENIVSKVSLSKGGVYRIYPSTKAILMDIIIEGMHSRNEYYKTRAIELSKEKKEIDIVDVVEVICDGMLYIPEIAALYTEFLIEKRHIPELETLYQEICAQTIEETRILIEQLGLSEKLMLDDKKMFKLTEIMNTAILGIVVLNHIEDFDEYKQSLFSAIIEVFK